MQLPRERVRNRMKRDVFGNAKFSDEVKDATKVSDAGLVEATTCCDVRIDVSASHDRCATGSIEDAPAED